MLDADDIKNLAVSSVKWSASQVIASQALPPLIMLIMARILVPEDFGILAVGMIATGFAQVFQDFGLSKTLIQRENKVNESANIVFWSNLVFGILIYLIILLSMPLITEFFHEPRLKDILPVLCLQIVLTSFATVHMGLLQREFKFKQLFIARLAFPVALGVVSVTLALLGHGVWALVWGYLAGSLAQTIVFWCLSHWRPTFNLDTVLLREVLGFGAWVTLEMFLAWLIIWADSMVLGHFLGVSELGIYRIGTMAVLLCFGIFLDPLVPIAYSSFSRLRSCLEDLRPIFINMTKIVVTICLPLGIGLALTANPIASVVLGPKWQGIEVVIAIIGLMYSVAWLVGLNPEVYRAIGRPDMNAKLLIANVVYYIPVYILAAPHGLLVFCVSRFSLAAVSLLLHFFVANKLLRVKFTYLTECLKSPLIASVAMTAIVYATLTLVAPFQGWSGLFKLVAIVIEGALTYLIVLRIIDKNLVIQIYRLAKQAIA